LTAYRNTVLLEVDASINSAAALCEELCGIVTDFGGAGIARLLDHSPRWAIFRVLEFETHAVAQAMGSSETSERTVQVLTDRSVRHLHDVRTVPAEVVRLRA